MQRQGVTRAELARRLGTSQAYITRVLSGNANFTLKTMARLAHALGMQLDVGLSLSGLPLRLPPRPESSPRRPAGDATQSGGRGG